VPWTDPNATTATLRAQAEEFLVATSSPRGRVYWCAGAGVTTTSRESLEAEVAVFDAFLSALVEIAPASIEVVLASSAGGVYAGSSDPPFSEHSEPRPLSPYGWAKLEMEHLVTRWAGEAGGWGLLARIANLYGPGQNLGKPQGLVSQLLRAYARRAPLPIVVPLDTLRDYIYVRDAADLIIDAADRVALSATGTSTTKVVASGRASSIATVICEVSRVVGRRVPVLVGLGPAGRYQVRDLRLRSCVLVEVDQRPFTPFPVGIRATWADVLQRVCAGQT
jgi:UDP-glucose 4-epimerase